MGVDPRILATALTEVTRFAENELGFPYIHVEAKDSYLRDDYPLPDNDSIFPHDDAPPSQNDGFNHLHDSAHQSWVDNLVNEAADAEPDDAQWIDDAILAEFEASRFLFPGSSLWPPTPGPSNAADATIPPTPRLRAIDTITDLSDIDEDIPLLPPAVGD
ncbi:hypothetical protein BJY01DRAFT_253519 [Aspergillus pseudoustus]|uniref:Uncharacterized protein n=1 Tax=Aspergillus pseudoustus TaxID=1810923 RepID=A0ABR4J094_9EURO